MNKRLDLLRKKIEIQRRDMLECSKKYPYHSEEVVAASKRLDATLNLYRNYITKAQAS